MRRRNMNFKEAGDLLEYSAEFLSLLREEFSDHPPAYVGLLGLLAGEEGEIDPLGPIGLGFGSSRRARELVLKGLILEHMWALKSAMEDFKPGRGNPGVAVSKDVRRVEYLIRLRKDLGRDCPTIDDLINVAVQIETQCVQLGLTQKSDRLFTGMVEPTTLSSSVSRGLRKLDMTGDDLLRTNPTE